MPALAAHSKILVTGGCGFLGRYLVAALNAQFATTALDVQNTPGVANFCSASVTDPVAVEEAW